MDSLTHPLVGQVVDGRYLVGEFIARGGMATVYRANDLRLDRTVALKVMHPSLAEDPEFVRRFKLEARSAASLSHPAIVAVFDQGAHNGIVYLAMEYVAGCTLRDQINSEGRLTAATALGVLEPVLEALSAAHAAGFAHRDIKPENVLIADDGRIKVADFGLARAIAASTQSGLTHGLLIGTVAYLAPEQVEHGYADTRTDVYSCGILLYECLVGQPPFSGETPLSVAYQHVHATVPVPSSIRSDIPKELDELVAIATRADPNARYGDAADFVAHLRTVRALLGNGAPLVHKTIVLDRSDSTLTVGPWATSTMTRNLVPPHSRTPTLTVEPATSAPPISPVPPTGPRVKRSRPFVRILIALLVLVLLGCGAGYGAWAWSKAQIVTMPQLVGMSQTQASAEASNNELSLTVAGQDYSDTVPKGAIVSADPAAGSQVRKGQLVTVHTSAGPETIAVPKLKGLTLAKALERLATARLEGRSTEEFSDTVATGKVISATPTGSTVVKIGSAVDLVVSKGPPPVKVPYLIGMSKSGAISTLANLGLKAVAKNQLPVVVLGRVYSQSVGSGTEVPKGSTITITIV